MGIVGVPDQDTTCRKCNAGLDEQTVGGVGDWKDKVVCNRCLNVRAGIPPHTIATLVGMQYGLLPEEAMRADAMSQKEFENVVLGGEQFKDLPPALNTTRWHARRLLASGQELS